jgi:hypothetical protein
MTRLFTYITPTATNLVSSHMGEISIRRWPQKDPTTAARDAIYFFAQGEGYSRGVAVGCADKRVWWWVLVISTARKM